MRKAILIGFFILLAIGAGYRATHHPVYDLCHNTPEGEVCKLIGYEGNK